jgi:hypothetical protein
MSQASFRAGAEPEGLGRMWVGLARWESPALREDLANARVGECTCDRNISIKIAHTEQAATAAVQHRVETAAGNDRRHAVDVCRRSGRHGTNHPAYSQSLSTIHVDRRSPNRRH